VNSGFSTTERIASLAGVPLTAGFYGKFLVFAQAVNAHQWALLGLGTITVGAGFYFYLRVVAAMYWQEPTDSSAIALSGLTKAAIALLVAGVFVFGINPKPVLSALGKQPAPVTATAH
jgi:NADH-quinone oxidoreductase subunit N